MNEPKYKIGALVWRATFDSEESRITCPDCGGHGTIRCILYDETMLSIECEGCKSGYYPPTGYRTVYDRKPRAACVIINGLEIEGGKIRYATTDSYRVDEDNLFLTESEALNCAQVMAAAVDREERERIYKKEKDTRSWSWHVHYYRRQIREAQATIERATAKLNVARIKAKEPAPAETKPAEGE